MKLEDVNKQAQVGQQQKLQHFFSHWLCKVFKLNLMNPSFAASLPASQLNCSRPQTADESIESTIKGKSMQYGQLEFAIKSKSM